MVEVLCKENLDEVLEDPQFYAVDWEDRALVRVFGENIDNPTYILIGQDEDDERYYLVVEDNDISEDYYVEDGQTLEELFNELFEKIMVEA